MLKHSAPYWAFLLRVERGLRPDPGTLQSVAKAAGTTRRHTVLLSPLHLDAGILSTLGRQLHLCLATWTACLRGWGCSTAGWWGHLVFTSLIEELSREHTAQDVNPPPPSCLLPSDEHLSSLELHFCSPLFFKCYLLWKGIKRKAKSASQPLCRIAAAI